MTRFLTRLLADRSGATAVEYGLILAMMFLVILGAVSAFGDAAAAMFDRVSTVIVGAMSGA